MRRKEQLTSAYAVELTFGEVMPRLNAALHRSAYLRLKHVLVPVDFTEASMRALPYARFLAKQFGCTVTLFHVIRPETDGEEQGEPLTLFLDEMKLAAERTLHQIASSLSLPEAEVTVRVGDPVEEILEEAAVCEADLIILGRRRQRGISRFLSPSTCRTIVSNATCPTLVADGEQLSAMRRDPWRASSSSRESANDTICLK